MAAAQICHLQRNDPARSAMKKPPLGGFFMASSSSILQRLCLKFVGLNSSCAIESFLPIGLAHVVHPNGLTRSGCVNEFAVTHINTHMAEGSLQRVEENQVAWLEFAAIDFFCDFGLLLSPSGQYQANRFFIHVTHKAAAIKAFSSLVPPLL